MRLVGTILLVCIGLAALKAAAIAVLALVAGAIVVSALVDPLKTLAAGFALVSLGVIGQYPLAGTAVLALVAICHALRD